MNNYQQNVFVNCPFDEGYKPLFHATLFAIHDCGYRARSALEVEDSGEVRIRKIMNIIESSRYSIHDISRTELDPNLNLPRFNMPLELGLFLGAQRYGNSVQQEKCCLILDKERYRYQAFISDIAGQDIQSHNNEVSKLIIIVRNWLRTQTPSPETVIPGGNKISNRYELFSQELPKIMEVYSLDPQTLTYIDYMDFMETWLEENPW